MNADKTDQMSEDLRPEDEDQSADEMNGEEGGDVKTNPNLIVNEEKEENEFGPEMRLEDRGQSEQKIMAFVDIGRELNVRMDGFGDEIRGRREEGEEERRQRKAAERERKRLRKLEKEAAKVREKELKKAAKEEANRVEKELKKRAKEERKRVEKELKRKFEKEEKSERKFEKKGSKEHRKSY